MKLTKKWKRLLHSKSSSASLNNVILICSYLSGSYLIHGLGKVIDVEDRWFAQVFINGLDCRRLGRRRNSEKTAKRDAERMAEELRMDARDGARQLMDKYGGADDD